ncbi:MAG: LysR substrate-binding domain-containing protein, partial [Comamonas sp.]
TLQGQVRLGVTDYFKPQALTALLARLAQAHPRMRLQVQVGKSAEVEAAWSQGALDLALTMAVGAAADAADGIAVLHTEPLVWAAQAGMATDGPDGLPLVVLPPGCALHQLSQRLLRAQGVAYEVMHQASGVAGLQAAVAAGLGVACLNQSALQEGMVALPANCGLPALPLVQFQLLPLRAEATPLLAQVRGLLQAQWAQPEAGSQRLG